ncbi:MAG: molybdopterin oxidoreductase family protein [Gemmataceae bacterium]|nr:molybdopterin oxidoreductase family protein [Gemmataceae bacterium]
MRRELTTVRAVCPHDCPDTCGIIVTVDPETGRAVRLRGDPDHPFTRGFLCQKVSNYLDRVYHPGRLLYPMRRVGRKGEGRFERISWPEAVRTIADRFQAIVASPDGPQAILPYSYAGTMGKLMYGSLDRRFFHRLGASLLDRTICATAGAAGCDVTLGTRAVVDPEAAVDCRYVVNWGSNTAVTNIHFWKVEFEARKRGAKIVTIDPYKSPTAAKSDRWIPIRPGTDAALALGVMHVLFRDGLVDSDYLERHCLGTEQLRERVMREFPPERVAAITGIPAADVERFAREYGTTRPALLRVNYGLQRHGGGGAAVRTIVCLPALTGDWRHPGAGAFLSTSKAYPFDGNSLERPDLIPPGTRTINMTQLAEALNGELPGPPVKALFVYNCNPAAVAPDQSRVLAGLRRDDLFTVVHEQFQTDTADHADILLPATTQLEHFDLHGSYGHLYVQANNPAIAPLGEAKPNTEVFRLLARAMGFEAELFEESDEAMAARSMGEPSGVSRRVNGAFSGISLADTKSGPVRLNLPRRWAPFADGHFPTPSGKCEFYSEREARAGRDPLPHYRPPHEDPQTRPELAAKYPLQMVCPPAAPFLNSSFVNVDVLRAADGKVTLEIHPTDAAARGITEGQSVTVFNDRGRFRATAVVGDTVKPGVVVSLGVWWNRFTDDGVNCNTTTSSAVTDLGGGATFFDNLVQVEAL